MPLKVLHVVPAVAARYGGPSAAIVGMSRALRTAGADVTVATTDADGAGRLEVEYERVQPYEGVPAIFFRRQGGDGFKYSRPLAVWLRAHAGDFDVLHVHAVFSHASLAAGRAARRRGVPYVLRPLGTIGPWNLRQKALRKRLVLAVGGRHLIESATVIHYTSEDERTQAEAALPNLPRSVVIPLGLDDAQAAAAPASPNRPYVLVLARLNEIKGIDLLIDAFALATEDERLAGWRLVVAGDGDPSYVAALKARSRILGPRVEFTGWVTGAARAALMGGASLFALPSRQESFGLAVAEAMTHGVPVVVTPGVALASEIAAAGAGWIAERTPDALAVTLRDAMIDPASRHSRGQAASMLCAQFQWPVVATRLLRLYEEVVHRGSIRVGAVECPVLAPGAPDSGH